MKYHHLCAEVNGQLRDVFVSDAEMIHNYNNQGVFFTPGALNISYQGMVEIEPESAAHVLPDVIG